MAKWCVPKVVSQSYRLGEVLVEVQRPGDCPSDLGDLQSVGESGCVVVAERSDEDLGLVLQPAKRLGVQYAVAVPLELRAHGRGLLWSRATPTSDRPLSER